jgi:hypothetical protein
MTFTLLGVSTTMDLNAFLGEWAIEATHPAFPDTVVRGQATFEWLEGERFLINRARNDHPDFPDSISVIGLVDERMAMYYFDSRGVHRVYEMSLEDDIWRIWRDAPGFSQRFRGEFSEDGSTLTGLFELSRDDSTWDDDLAITYRRLPARRE